MAEANMQLDSAYRNNGAPSTSINDRRTGPIKADFLRRVYRREEK